MFFSAKLSPLFINPLMAQSKLSKGWMIFIAVAVLAFIIISWLVNSYNRLVTLDETVEQAWSQVEVQYQRRGDLIPNLISTVSGAADFEQTVITDVTEARSAWQNTASDPNASLNDRVEASSAYDSALSRLLVTVEAYPNLTATQGFRDLQVQLEGTENRIAVARADFNTTATEYNIVVRRVPMNIIAGLFGFDSQDLFASDAGNENAPEVEFEF